MTLFAVPFIPLIVTDSLFFPFITGKNFTFRILVEIAFVSWGLLALYDPKYRPKFSWVATGFAALLVVMLFANSLGEYPLKSFWSNFERMDGYVTLVHVFLYLLVLGSTLTTVKVWHWFFNTTLLAASILSLYAFGQLSGAYQINQGGVRVDGTLGNAAYMAVYMLFHIFIALYMATQAKSVYAKSAYGFLAAVFFYLLVQTATRGTMIGLVGGLVLAGAYIALFSANAHKTRRFALGGLVALIIMVSGFVAAKDTSFVTENPILNRIASISLEDGSTRFQIWGMAFEGVKERPILGWGQGNFNYVFNKYYQPELYAQEPWFDRVHNIVMDWLIAGGVLGLLAYAAIFIGALFHIVIRPRLYKDESFTVVEQGLLLGLLAAYFIHNTFVFDNIVSYIFFGTILAFIHARSGTAVESVQQYRLPEKIISTIVAPTTVALALVVMYVVNVPAIQAATDLIDAFKAQSAQGMLAEFESALARDSYANQEIREQITQRAQSVAQAPGISEDVKAAFAARTEAELLKQIEEKPGDARVHVFVSSYYRSVNELEKAREQLVLARTFSPLKQQIIFEQGFVELQSGNNDAALSFFKEAFELDERYRLARTYYATAFLYASQPEAAEALFTDEKDLEFFAQNDMAINAAVNTKSYGLLIQMAQIRAAKNPDNLQNQVSLASVYFDAGNVEQAIEVLEQAIEKFPNFATQGQQFIDDINAGRKPGSQPVEVTVGEQSVRVNRQ